jgi:hypothetical protein
MQNSRCSISASAFAWALAAALFAGCASTSTQPSATAPPGQKPGKSKQVELTQADSKALGQVTLLFVQNAQGVSLDNGKLTLKGISPTTIYFSDRPERIAGHMTMKEFVPFWTEGKDSFLSDPPNATLSALSGGSVKDFVVELRNPRLSGDELSYDIRLLEGVLPINDGPCSLFIDVIGMPCTPYSYAGACRRAYRWR